MKNHRFPWLRNRTTDNRKCEKARNIKEKRTIEMFNTVSKQPAELRSSPNVNHGLVIQLQNDLQTSQGIFSERFLFEMKNKRLQSSRGKCRGRIVLIQNSSVS